MRGRLPNLGLAHDYLVDSQLYLPGGPSDRRKLAADLQVIATRHRAQKLDVSVRTPQPLVSVVPDADLRAGVADKLHYPGAVDQAATVVDILR